MSRFVRDSHAFSLLFKHPANWDFVPHCYWQSFIKWLCGESSEAVIRGRGGLFDHVNQTGTRTQVRAHPPTKNNANQVRMAPACSTRHGWKGRKNTTRTTKERKCSYNKHWETIHHCGKSLVKFCMKSFFCFTRRWIRRETSQTMLDSQKAL